MLDFDDFGTLCHGYSDEWLCEHLDITPRTLRDWKSGKRTAPAPVRHLLKIMNYGQLEAIGGKDWEGFSLNRDHTLTVPLFHRPFTARQLGAMFFTTQDAWMVRADLARAMRENAALKEELLQERAKRRQRVKVEIDGEEVYSNAEAFG